jgi:hypothetical protein
MREMRGPSTASPLEDDNPETETQETLQQALEGAFGSASVPFLRPLHTPQPQCSIHLPYRSN